LNPGRETPVRFDGIAEGRMLTIFGLMATIVAVLVVFPDTGIGRGLNRWLVDRPARALNRIRLGKIAFYALMALMGTALVLLFEAEGLRLFGMMAPDTLVWFAMFDVGVFVDALLITGAILASNGLRAARAWISAVPRQVVAVAARLSARARRPRRRPSRSTGKTSNDEGPGWTVQPAYRPFSIA
jgi:hypothetical protein